jgi:hypothetical protein
MTAETVRSISADDRRRLNILSRIETPFENDTRLQGIAGLAQRISPQGPCNRRRRQLGSEYASARPVRAQGTRCRGTERSSPRRSWSDRPGPKKCCDCVDQ